MELTSDVNEQRVLVTGASGYIATHIIKKLQELGYRVRGTVRDLTNHKKVDPLFDLCSNAKYKLELAEADLLNEKSWERAVDKCEYVMHVASPFILKIKNPTDVIKPAVEGTLSVLKACVKAKTVKKVIITSSCAAVFGDPIPDENKIYSERDWTDPDLPHVDDYYRSKTLAERAAWEFVKNLPCEQKFDLVTINPAVVFGPILNCNVASATSVQILKDILVRRLPVSPHLSMGVCDVRDVAEAHIQAMVRPEASGHRHIIITCTMFMSEMGQILSRKLTPLGYYPTTRTIPNIFVFIGKFFDKQLRQFVYPRLGVKMLNVLKVKAHPIEETLLDTAHSLIRLGIVPMTSKYKSSYNQ